MEIKFKRDTAFRKQFFVPNSFAHPAKMDAQLLIWIVERYSKEGETLLDPMAGSGTAMLACGLGRNVILVELEEKFCKMMRDNWEEVRMRPQLGSQMGDCQIIQEDARQLEGLLVDKIVTSPPYAENTHHGDDPAELEHLRPGRTARVSGTAGDNKDNIGQLPYGSIDKIVTSPPFGSDNDTRIREDLRPNRSGPLGTLGGDNPSNLGNLKYGEIDAVVTSPPYENQLKIGREHGGIVGREVADGVKSGNLGVPQLYSREPDNIGNLKSDSYLSAMLQVYQQCHSILKSQGLMILVTKNFIRNKQVVRLDTDTVKLCEQAGFKFLERHYRKLPSQSFWRVIYHQKHPEVEQINHEDVLVFSKDQINITKG